MILHNPKVRCHTWEIMPATNTELPKHSCINARETFLHGRIYNLGCTAQMGNQKLSKSIKLMPYMCMSICDDWETVYSEMTWEE